MPMHITQQYQTILPKHYHTTPPSYAHVTAMNINNLYLSPCSGIENKLHAFLTNSEQHDIKQ